MYNQNSNKLFKVTIKAGTFYYIVATDPTSAYLRIRKYLDDRSWFFTGERTLNDIELIAEDAEYPDCEVKLFSETDELELAKKALRLAREGVADWCANSLEFNKICEQLKI